MSNRDLSKVQARVPRADRKVDRRSGIIGDVDPRQQQFRGFADMRTARRGDGGADKLLRSLGMLGDSLGDAQKVAQADYAAKEKDAYEEGLIAAVTGETPEDRIAKRDGYRRGLAVAGTETRWYQHKAQKDLEFEEFLENQTGYDLDQRRKEALSWVEQNYFEGFVKDPETGEILDLGDRDAYLLAIDHIQKNRPQLLAGAMQRINERFEGEALTLAGDSIRETIMAGDKVDYNVILERIPPNIPQEKVTLAIIGSVRATADQLKRSNRHQEAIAIIDQFLGYAAASDVMAVDIPASGEDGEAVLEAVEAKAEAAVGRLRIASDTLAEAVMHVESRGNPNAVSPVGARGTMQTMPGTLKDPGYGVKPAKDDSPAELERVGKDYLKAMVREYNGSIPLALAAYNAGPGTVNKWIKDGTVPDPRKRGVSEAAFWDAIPFAETKNYVRDVTARAGAPLTAGGADASAVEPGYTHRNGEQRDVSERSLDPSFKLLPELRGRFAPTADQREAMGQLRSSLVSDWRTADARETARVAAEVNGDFALRIVGMGEPLTDADVKEAHKGGLIDDQTAARWFKGIDEAAEAEMARAEVEADRSRKAELEAAETASRGMLGSLMDGVFSGKKTPREAITDALEKAPLIADPVVRGQFLFEVRRFAEGMEGLNLATPEAQEVEQNFENATRDFPSKLPPGLFYGRATANGAYQPMNRQTAEALINAEIGRRRLEVLRAIAEGKKPDWKATEKSLMSWFSSTFTTQHPQAAQQAARNAGHSNAYAASGAGFN